ncbi:MAG: PKD domain-containing protein [Candidatus Hadarchaeales archaeon]
MGGGRKLNLPVVIILVVIIIVVIAAALILSSGGGSTPSGLNASFTYSPSNPQAGQNVAFTDTSTGDIVSWSWDFGDGNTSTDRNPTHQFSAGTYTVTLTVTSSGGQSDTYSRSITVGGGTAGEYIAVFNDAGLLPELGLQVDAFVWPQEGEYGLTAPYVEGQYTGVSGIPEGVSCWYTRNGPESNAYAGWGVFVGANSSMPGGIDPSATHYIDLSGVDTLEFYVKSPVNLHVELQSWNLTTDNKGIKSNQVWIGNYGWANTGGWEKITIPKSAFRNVDFQYIWCPFMISTAGSNPNVEWYVDWVNWVKS